MKAIGIIMLLIVFLYALAYFPILAIIYGVLLIGFVVYAFMTDVVTMVRIMLENEENDRTSL